MIGRVTSVEQDRQGVTLDGDHAEGATSLTVTEAFDLEPGGGHLSLPSGETVEYGPVDTEGVTVPLIGELPEAVEDAERLEVHPPMVTTVAYVSIDDTDESTPIPVTVPADVAGWSTLAPGASLRFEVTKGGDLVATDVIAGALEVAADQVSAGTIRSEWRMSRDGAIVVGDDEVGSGEFTYDGLRFSKPGPMGLPYENVVMTTEETSFGVMGEDGTRLGGISDTGGVSGTTGSFEEDVTVAGEPLLGTLAEGAVEPGWLDRFPRGMIARFSKVGTGASIVTGVERAYLRTSATLYPGRQYRIRAWMRANLMVDDSALTLWIRYAPGRAELASPTLPDTVNFSVSNASANHNITGWGEGFLTVEEQTQMGFLLSYRGDYGATPAASRTQFYVEDVGPIEVPVGGEEEEPDTALYTTTWQASASRMYRQDGSAISGRDGDIDLWFWHGTPVEYQSCAFVYGTGAVDSTYAGELSKTLPDALAGASIQKVEVRLRNKVWYGSPVNMAFSTLNASSLPSSRVVTRQLTVDNRNYQAGEARWWTLPSDWFTNGSNRGVCLGDYRGQIAGGLDLTSGSFHGIDDNEPPLLRITYTR